MLSDVGRGTPRMRSEGLSRVPIPQLELMISSGYLRGPSKVSRAICVLSIHCGPTSLPCLLPPTRVAGLLPACTVLKCISASAAENNECEEASGFWQRQLLQPLGLVQGQERSMWWEQSGHQAASELHLLVTVSHLAESCQGRERRPCPSPSLLPQPHAPAPFLLGCF